MKSRIQYMFFWIAYHLNNLVNKIRPKRKAYRYMILVTGRFPVNLSTAIKTVLKPNGYVRFSIGQNQVALVFESYHDFLETDGLLKTLLQGHADTFFLLQLGGLGQNFHAINMNEIMYRNLFAPLHDPALLALTPHDILEEMQLTLNNIRLTRDRLTDFVRDIKEEMEQFNQNQQMFADEEDFFGENEVTREPTAEDIEMEVNRIIDKMKEVGYEKLTDAEKNKLIKYGN